MSKLQRAVSLIYPEQCALCPEIVDHAGGLCASCWAKTRFLTGLVCDICGCSLPGAEDEADAVCDECLSRPRPWRKGRAAISYQDAGRRFVLALKHGDRTDLTKPAANWILRAGHECLKPETVLVPVPVHWSRLLRRRYNQAAELARSIGQQTGHQVINDALVRTRRTPPQDGLTIEERYENLVGAFAINPRRRQELQNRHICLIDDVMTSGATLATTAKTILASDAGQLSVLVLARVEKSS